MPPIESVALRIRSGLRIFVASIPRIKIRGFNGSVLRAALRTHEMNNQCCQLKVFLDLNLNLDLDLNLDFQST
jgi:hypothetical protein